MASQYISYNDAIDLIQKLDKELYLLKGKVLEIREAINQGNLNEEDINNIRVLEEKLLSNEPPDSSNDPIKNFDIRIFEPIIHILNRNERTDFRKFFVFDIVLKVSFEPFHMAIAFKGENRRCDTVEKPAIVELLAM